MSAAEKLAMMTPHGLNVDHIPGGISKLSGIDVAGACGMAGLTGPEYRLMLAKYCGDAKCLQELEYDAWLLVADIAIKNQWRAVRGKPYLRTLARIGLIEVIADHRCQVCGGTGLDQKFRPCTHCRGSGVCNLPRPAVIEQQYGLSAEAWRKTWASRFPLVVAELQRMEGSAITKIALKFRD